MDKKKFGSFIKESRINKNYTQKELADLLFVDVTTVSKWERGVSYPDITLVSDICKILEIDEHELIVSGSDIKYRKMKKDARKYNNMKKGAFWTLNICYALAVLVCFVVNISVSHTLSWFFIVLTSILCAYSFCPTFTWIFKKHQKIVFIFSTFVSMFLLFLTCSLYSNNYWFMIATIGVFLGYFIAFYPGLFKGQKEYLSEEKYNKLSKYFLLSYILVIFIIIILLLVSIYAYTKFNLKMSLLITGGIFMIPITYGILNLFSISNTLNKVLTIALIGVFVIGFLFGIGRAIYLKNTEITKTYMIEENYNTINIINKNMDVNIYLANDNINKVVYVENKKIEVHIDIQDGALNINQNDSRKFYDMLFNFSDFKIDLYLTKDLIDSLNIKSNTSDIEIHQGLAFNSVDIVNSTGDVEFASEVNSNLNIESSTGDIELKNSNVLGDLNIKTKTGDIELEKVNSNKLYLEASTGDIKLVDVLVTTDLNIEASTGDVRFDGIDANNIYVKVSTGDVKGTILTSKIFIARSETGSIRVPETTTGGICKISAGTGDIIISYKNQ